MAYSVLSGETIQDAAFNITGSLAGIDPLLELNTPQDVPMVDWKTMQDRMDVPDSNFMETYTPDLYAGQLFDTDGLVVENLDATLGRRFNSSMQNPTQVKAEIDELWWKLFPPSLVDLPIGYNLRGKTIRFLDTDKLTMTAPPVNRDDAWLLARDSTSDATLIIIGAKLWLDDNIQYYTMIGAQKTFGENPLFIFADIDGSGDLKWRNTEIVVPDTFDFIIERNELYIVEPMYGRWDFSHTEII